jgi:hypothetical protein
MTQASSSQTAKQVYEGLKGSIARQREVLSEMLRSPLKTIAEQCAEKWGDHEALNQTLISGLDHLPYCHFLYTLDTEAKQISDNVSRKGLLPEHYGRDRSDRPYIKNIPEGENFILSGAYMSLRAHRPSVTAIQIVKKDGEFIGYIGADFDLRDLPLTKVLYEQPPQWHQIKGDPSIRGNVFFQTRVQSRMDEQLPDAIAIIEELMCGHGVFHTQLHFSSSRAIIWLANDPFRYRLLDVNEILDPETCFAYPNVPYPKNAVIKSKEIRLILENFRELRFGDESIYLRSGSVNIFNGLIGLNFSCDGSHYIPHTDFLKQDISFWGISAASGKK